MLTVSVLPERTAHRLEWRFLPPHIRGEVERQVGTVVEATSCQQGFTPGFASVLTTDDGGRHFVKAASVQAQRAVAASYRTEAEWLHRLDARLPIPALTWFHESDWVVLAIEHAPGLTPLAPWEDDELARCLEVAATIGEHRAGDTLPLTPFADDFADVAQSLPWALAAFPDLPIDALADLLELVPAATDGDRLVHSEARGDNFLLDPEQTLLADWAWPTRGAGWLDAVMLLTSAYADGVDAEALLSTLPTLAGVRTEHVDALLALQLTWYARACSRPVPHNSPFLREHQRRLTVAAADWLCRRRGWPRP
ncbi:hypothetical protein NODU109028_15145 [Nocardioides dubius]|uniref:Aminoglycoside phosphotransferase domain-containing protein n=1 Tax=Nocardioides dubius TaxID=317019 RepID=A0ABP4EQA4_9ACTN